MGRAHISHPTNYSELAGNGYIQWLTKEQGIRLVESVVRKGTLSCKVPGDLIQMTISVACAGIDRDAVGVNRWFTGNVVIEDQRTGSIHRYSCKFSWESSARLDEFDNPLTVLFGFSGLTQLVSGPVLFQVVSQTLQSRLEDIMTLCALEEPVSLSELVPACTPWDVLD